MASIIGFEIVVSYLFSKFLDHEQSLELLLYFLLPALYLRVPA
jgi:hypothetical protein